MLTPAKIVPFGNNLMCVFGGSINVNSIKSKGVSTGNIMGEPCLLAGDDIAIPLGLLKMQNADQIIFFLAGGEPTNCVATEFHQFTLDQRMIGKIELWLEMQNVERKSS